jgi:CheY-like chemotaxis protein
MRPYMSPHSCIVIVDDEPVIASSLAAILRMKGFSARFFTCPLEALAAARRSSESPGASKDCGTPSLDGGVSGLLD